MDKFNKSPTFMASKGPFMPAQDSEPLKLERKYQFN